MKEDRLESFMFGLLVVVAVNGGVAWTISKAAAQKYGYPFPGRRFDRNSLSHDILLSEVKPRRRQGHSFRSSPVPRSLRHQTPLTSLIWVGFQSS